MKICPWDEVTPEIESLGMDTIVYSIELPPCDIVKTPQLCDCAWTAETEIFSHHWMSSTFDLSPRVFSITLGEYLRRHKAEVPAMNPLWGVARIEFLAKLGVLNF